MSAPLPDLSHLGVAQLRRLQAEAAEHAGLPGFFSDPLPDGSRGPELAVIPAGRLRLEEAREPRRFGDSTGHEWVQERPFALGRHTVTAGEFADYAMAVGFRWPDHLIRAEGRMPVINLSAEQAEDYLGWLSSQTDQHYRLPTEAEWEYAARAGATTDFCFGVALTCGEANIHTVRPPLGQVRGWRRWLPFCVPLNRGCEVGSYPANLWGLFEVHGNVWEFTGDTWTGPLDAYSPARRTPPGQWIVTKGGSWFEGPLDARFPARRPRLRSEIDVNLGLRVLRELA